MRNQAPQESFPKVSGGNNDKASTLKTFLIFSKCKLRKLAPYNF